MAQQAAEKALKSLLLNLGKTIRSNDLNELLNIIKTESSISVDEIRDDVRKLTVHYTISRYPDVSNSLPAELYSKEDAEELVRRSEKVVTWVRRNLQ